MENKKKMLKSVLAFLGLPLLMILIFALVNGINPEKSYNYSEIIDKFKNHQVVMYNLNLGSGSMEIKLKDDSVIYYTAPSADMIYSDIKNYVNEYNAQNPTPMTYDITKPVESSWLVSTFSVVILPTLILFALGWIFIRRLNAMSGEAGKQFGFGKARLKNGAASTRKATFADVAGADEEKEELSEIVDFLKAPEKYTTMGARIPKGLLLVGPPGTGKTLLARAVAGEANVTFFSMSGSDFAEMYVGVGASRVRDLFEQAKKNSPCIVFIDEIDAVGRKRSSGSGSTASYDEAQTLNQLLVEMDGFDENQGVIIIAATNRPDILDPALLRPGRFDRQIFVGYPDVKGREEILKVHSKGKHFGDDVNLATIAKTTAGFTGADLENLVNESAILAVRRGKKEITMPEIEEATIKVSMGPEKKSKIISKEEKMHTAYHEAGHAITAFCCGNKEKVHEISIIPRGQAGGYTLYLPEKDDRCVFKKEMLEKIMVALGGRAAEELILKDTSTGVSSDISKATDMAKAMVTKYGMNESLGPIVFNPASLDDFIYTNGEGAKSYSETTAAKIDDEVKKIITSCYERSKNILENNTDKLHKVAEFLITNEKMNQEQFENIMQSTQPEKNDEMQEKR